MFSYPYLYDEQFLKAFDNENFKTQYIRITVLDFFSEVPIATIEGKSLNGSVSLSGTSNMRRTGSCSLAVDPNGIRRLGSIGTVQYYNITDVNNLISMNKKVQIETGFINYLKTSFPQYQTYDILWFPLGTYVIKAMNISSNNSGTNISLTLNDKCALLNGDIGGVIPAATILSEKETYSNKMTTRKVKKILIKDIIRNLVVEFGGERPENVIVTDIPDTIVKVMKWNGTNPLYYMTDTNGGKYFLQTKRESFNLQATFLQGQDVCYMNEPFVYPGMLECNAGETVASVLDKIKNVLGNYEWFYDLQGHFVFQEIKNYLNTSLAGSLLELEENDYRLQNNLSSSVYTFDEKNKHLLSSISNAPQLQNIKNDFIVWGTAKTTSGANKPIRYHLTLGTRPHVNVNNKRLALVYTDHRNLKMIIPLKEGINYQKVTSPPNNSSYNHDFYYYYRDNVNSLNKIYYWHEEAEAFVTDAEYKICYLQTDDWRTELYFQGLWADDLTFAQYPYSAELNSEWPKIYDIMPDDNLVSIDNYIPCYKGKYYNANNTSNYDYWLDILEGSDFSVDLIGRRTKCVVDNNINCIFATEILNLVLIEADGEVQNERELAAQKDQEVVQVSSAVFKNLTLGGSHTTAFDKIKDLLYQHTSYNESISLSIVPIYHLEPNTRIKIRDNNIGINGEYMIKSISIPLTPNGTSSISATKIVEKTF